MIMKAIVMCLTIAGIVLCVLVPSTSAQSAQISVEPLYLEVSQGENFTVNIIVDPGNDTEVYSVQYDLYFDNALLNVTYPTKGTFLSQDGERTNPFIKKINNTIGKIEYGESRMGTEVGVTGSGTLTTITFQAIAEQGVSELRLENVKASDPTTAPISIEVNNGTCNIKAIEQTPTQTPTPELTTTAPAQIMQIPDTNQTPSLPSQSPNASITPTVMHTSVTTQTTPSEPKTTATTSVQTIHTPAEKWLPGFEASFAIAVMFVAFIIMRRR
jgi:hypothetical protein